MPPLVLALGGSLRRLSANNALARAAAASSPGNVTLWPSPLSDLPFFDADIEVPLPPSVAALRAAAFDASGFFFGSPEYNGLPTAVLKNALDWLSRGGPEKLSPLKGKPFAIASAAGRSGGANSQRALASMLTGACSMQHIGADALLVNQWDGTIHFDAVSGDLIDEEVRARIAARVGELVEAAATVWQAKQTAKAGTPA